MLPSISSMSRRTFFLWQMTHAFTVRRLRCGFSFGDIFPIERSRLRGGWKATRGHHVDDSVIFNIFFSSISDLTSVGLRKRDRQVGDHVKRCRRIAELRRKGRLCALAGNVDLTEQGYKSFYGLQNALLALIEPILSDQSFVTSHASYISQYHSQLPRITGKLMFR